ncbi:ABC transporter ATP-binding protein [Candidatus Poribacteria bacterium]|nr:ABC transporter ATP-binding protein [Candidatus Poribacteria bacterium]
MVPALQVTDLDVHYGAIHALKGMHLSVEPGQIVALLGANGAGKTTTLRAISGLVKPTGGRILLDGKPLAGLRPHEIVRRGVVQAPEGRGIFPELTVSENLDLGGFVRTDKEALARDREWALDLFPRIRERLGQQAGTLSGGEQQMLSIARALLAKPRVLLLDEPSLGLAPQIVTTIFHIIREINKQGTTILLVEQNAHMALQTAHMAFVLEVGRIVMEGRASDLAETDEIKKAYLGG